MKMPTRADIKAKAQLYWTNTKLAATKARTAAATHPRATKMLGGLALAGAVAAGSHFYNRAQENTPHPAPAIVTNTHTNEYNLPHSLASTLDFHQDQTTQKANANLFIWQGKPYVVNTNNHARPGELNFTLQALNDSTLVFNNGTNTAFADGQLYLFVPVTNTASGQPVTGWQFPTNGLDKLAATRHYPTVQMNNKLSGKAQGLEVRLNRPLEIATVNGIPYHVDNDLIQKANRSPATNALPFVFVKTDALQTYSPAGHMEVTRKNNEPIVYRAVTIPQEAYFARTNQSSITTNAPSTGVDLE